MNVSELNSLPYLFGVDALCKTREGENHFAWGRCGVDPEALCMLRKRLNNQDRNWSTLMNQKKIKNLLKKLTNNIKIKEINIYGLNDMRSSSESQIIVSKCEIYFLYDLSFLLNHKGNKLEDE
ncbi:hypothetical protein BCR32DRAFT_293725 [Anaeromyces robustus]|uniref:Uncharacterized protein n=1 Tax=Anaeromyces robustus TaxID=1754192 RepID=A0A1Y1X5U0_9FUNG|nr:hypothetical protein BCR32DRAFT_293725 [Anaeromyces robustus]|eukprot:ORX80664.1 hypothetical protein BCR32DRAFT_293725 [Anaeromyces robustus]